MKTQTLLRTLVGISASGLLAAAAFAGPGPQFWNRPAATSAPKPDAPKTEVPATAKCDGCKTTPIWVFNDRGPAGKGTPAARVVGKKHECVRCTGALANESGKVKNNMAHNAVCGPLLCCK
jgi:hypothetical protein